MVGFAILGVLLNVLDLTAGTHLTKDPDVGLVLSIVLVPFGIGFYFIGAKTRGEPCWIAGEESRLQCAGLNRHEVEDARALRERNSDPLGLESCAATARDTAKRRQRIGGVGIQLRKDAIRTPTSL